MGLEAPKKELELSERSTLIIEPPMVREVKN